MCAVNTLQQLLARCEDVMDAVKTLWERRVDAVGTLRGRCVHVITDKFDNMVLERCTNAEASLFGVTGA